MSSLRDSKRLHLGAACLVLVVFAGTTFAQRGGAGSRDSQPAARSGDSSRQSSSSRAPAPMAQASRPSSPIQRMVESMRQPSIAPRPVVPPSPVMSAPVRIAPPAPRAAPPAFNQPANPQALNVRPNPMKDTAVGRMFENARSMIQRTKPQPAGPSVTTPNDGAVQPRTSRQVQGSRIGGPIVVNPPSSKQTPVDQVSRGRSILMDRLTKPGQAATRKIPQQPPADAQRIDRQREKSDPKPPVTIPDRIRTSIENIRGRIEAKRGKPAPAVDGERPHPGNPQQTRPDGQNRQRDVVVDGTYHRSKADLFRCKTVWPARVVYHDRPREMDHDDRYVHMFYDTYGYPCHQLIWPTFQFGVWYHHRGDWAVNFVYPFYHRKYVFVSLDGWWPTDCTSIRYYWYGYHPYEWYGYNPVAREVRSDTYNYYTYNYYSTDSTAATSNKQQAIYGIPVDKLTPRPKGTVQAEQDQSPSQPTVADVWFENGVKAFESEQYAAAVEDFRQAMESDDRDRIVPFACAQALFADGRYAEAAEALRQALARQSDQSQGIFYPRGLYKDDETLYGHIDHLMDQIEKSPSDVDLQLLLGYHLLGIGEAGQALGPLQQARGDERNAQAVKVLMDLQQKIEEKSVTEKGAE